MNSFYMNGYLWHVYFIDPYNDLLVDRTNTLRVATTDPKTSSIFLSIYLQGDFLRHVLTHELGHCVMFSYHLLDDIHRMVHPKYWVEAEEWVCNFIADYSFDVLNIVNWILGDSNYIY